MLKRSAPVAVIAACTIAVPVYASTQEPEVPLAPPDRSPLDARTVQLGSAELVDGPSGRVRSARMTTSSFTMVGVTWRGDAVPDVDVRTRDGRRWGAWQDLQPLGEHAPDPGTGESRRSADLSATDLLWVGPSDGVQVRFDGDPAKRARLVLVDPGTPPRDRRAAATGPVADTVESRDPTAAPQPVVRSRSAWGADESWRDGSPVYNNRIKQAHIHHTAGTNEYSRSDVPAIIRGDYWYHTQVLGWSDLGYNFVVDRFGRIWEGRAGGIGRPVRGAHTLGFNHASFGVAAIGDYEQAKPSAELVRALVRLSAWKLDRHGAQPAGQTVVTSQGSDRYPEGTRVRLPVIDGHRDTNQTACPGDGLYVKLPDIRRRAQRRADAVHAPG